MDIATTTIAEYPGRLQALEDQIAERGIISRTTLQELRETIKETSRLQETKARIAALHGRIEEELERHPEEAEEVARLMVEFSQKLTVFFEEAELVTQEEKFGQALKENLPYLSGKSRLVIQKTVRNTISHVLKPIHGIMIYDRLTKELKRIRDIRVTETKILTIINISLVGLTRHPEYDLEELFAFPEIVKAWLRLDALILEGETRRKLRELMNTCHEMEVDYVLQGIRDRDTLKLKTAIKEPIIKNDRIGEVIMAQLGIIEANLH